MIISKKNNKNKRQIKSQKHIKKMSKKNNETPEIINAESDEKTIKEGAPGEVFLEETQPLEPNINALDETGYINPDNNNTVVEGLDEPKSVNEDVPVKEEPSLVELEQEPPQAPMHIEFTIDAAAVEMANRLNNREPEFDEIKTPTDNVAVVPEFENEIPESDIQSFLYQVEQFKQQQQELEQQQQSQQPQQQQQQQQQQQPEMVVKKNTMVVWYILLVIGIILFIAALIAIFYNRKNK